MKVTKPYAPRAVELVTNLLRDVLSKDEVRGASVERVFPDVTAGRRAGMLVVSLDDGMSPRSVNRVLDSLRSSEAVEYAQRAEPKSPQAASSRKS